MVKPAQTISLDSLVFFESAVRHLNFTLVAEEFGSSQPAVSQRIAALEKDLRTPLFKRAHRGVSLTADGVALHEAVRDHLAAIGLAVDKLRTRRTRQVITVATDFGFAQFWLMPRLAEFQKLRPELDVRIVTSQQAFDIRGEAVDLAISFGDGQWPGCDALQIWPEEVVPVCSAAMLERHAAAGGTPGAVMALPLLHLGSSGQEPWMTWQQWAQLQGLPADGKLQSLTLGNYPLLIQAAVAGHGVALGWRPLVDALLRDGQLVSLPVPSLTTRRGYFLVQPRGREPWEALDSLRNWIVAGCEAQK
ncbi:choline sulfate utilization transcriptional regulator [Janthinobacterium sp.]|uniref:choline sulfate utilization transcriptional regulator n=1 Tax=Janthinobacterium sp. TaxID=1871054 RepID=UPI0028981524|nr:LysR substrate-binding domain-containing protein [Janthinobacterium sp.]